MTLRYWNTMLKTVELDITLKIFCQKRAKMAENDWNWKEMLLVGDMVSSAAVYSLFLIKIKTSLWSIKI